MEFFVYNVVLPLLIGAVLTQALINIQNSRR